MQKHAVIVRNSGMHLYVEKSPEPGPLVLAIQQGERAQQSLKPKRDWFGASAIAMIFIFGVVLYSL